MTVFFMPSSSVQGRRESPNSALGILQRGERDGESSCLTAKVDVIHCRQALNTNQGPQCPSLDENNRKSKRPMFIVTLSQLTFIPCLVRQSIRNTVGPDLVLH